MKKNKCTVDLVLSMVTLAKESTELFIEDQAFSLPYDLAPPSTPSRPSIISEKER
jgi:hypothetical protein